MDGNSWGQTGTHTSLSSSQATLFNDGIEAGGEAGTLHNRAKHALDPGFKEGERRGAVSPSQQGDRTVKWQHLMACSGLPSMRKIRLLKSTCIHLGCVPVRKLQTDLSVPEIYFIKGSITEG